MQIGIDSFAAAYDDAQPRGRLRRSGCATWSSRSSTPTRSGWTSSASASTTARSSSTPRPPVILGAAAARTRRIRLTSAVTVLSAADPVRVFQSSPRSTCSRRGGPRWSSAAARSSRRSRCSACDLEDYDSLFAEKLDLLLKIRDDEHVALVRQAPAAADRPGRLPATGAGPAADLAGRRRDAGLVRPRRRARAAADGRDHRRRAAALPAARRPLPGGRAARAGHPPDQLKVGVHALGLRRGDDRGGGRRFLPRLRARLHRRRQGARLAAGDAGRLRRPARAGGRAARRQPRRGGREDRAAQRGAGRDLAGHFQMNAASVAARASSCGRSRLLGEGVAPVLRDVREAA